MLFEELDRRGVRYCHWKSNVRLDKTLAGTEDIDLLVHPADSHEFQAAINQCGFKMAVSHLGAGHMGVFHALALDQDLGILLDLHAYHQIVSGDSFVKSFRFPVEQDLLMRSTVSMGVRVADPTAELVLFLLRTLLKHGSVIEIIKVGRDFGEARAELSWLLQRADRTEADVLLRQWFPLISLSIGQMADCIALGSLPARIAMGLRVAWGLRHRRRLGHVAAFFSRIMRITRHYTVRARGRRNLSLLSGGAWFALTGPKGTGKSTLVGLISKRLAKNLDVRVIHIGKPPASWLSAVPRMLVPAVRKAVPIEHLSEYEKPERRADRRYSNLFVVGKWLVAYDRQRLLNRAMREMASGTIIISDRCPTTNSTGLDGSAFDDLAVAKARSSFQRWLMEKERSMYRRMPIPRVVLKLGAPLEIALERDRSRVKVGGPDPLAVQRRWNLECKAEYDKSCVCPVDTSGSIDETLRHALDCVWKAL